LLVKYRIKKSYDQELVLVENWPRFLYIQYVRSNQKSKAWKIGETAALHDFETICDHVHICSLLVNTTALTPPFKMLTPKQQQQLEVLDDLAMNNKLSPDARVVWERLNSAARADGMFVYADKLVKSASKSFQHS